MKLRAAISGFTRLVLGMGLLVISVLAHASPAPQLLPNPNPNAQDNFYGNAVALSPDGSIAVVAANSGGYGLDTPPAMYVFQYANSAWGATPIITICDPAANASCTSDSEPTDLFASSVSVSSINSNAFLLIVGSPGGGVISGSPVTYGVVYIYKCTVSPAACGTPVATISDPSTSPSASDNFGSAVAISQDGNTVLVGAWGTPEPGGSGVGNQIEPNVGSAYIYTTSGDVWPATPTVTATLSEYGVTCAPFGSSIVCDKFGYAVALSADGTAAIVGAPGVVDNGNPGEGNAYAFGVVSGSWQDLPETTLYNSDGTTCTDVVTNSCDEYGSAVALSADGSTALVGAPNALAAGAAFGEYGLVSLFHQLVPGTWAGVTSPTIIYSNPNQNQNTVYTGIGGFGTSLALSNDGTTVLVGLPEGAEGTNDGGYGGSGEMDSYTCNFSSSPPCVNTPGQVLVDPVVLVNPGASFEPPDFFGAAAAISNGADVLLAGAPDSNLYGANDNGAAYAYGAPGSQLTLSLTLTATPSPVAPNGNLTYDLTVTNTSTLTSANGITLTDVLPNNNSPQINAGGGSCSFLNNNGIFTVTCTLASLAAGASWQVSIVLGAGPIPQIVTDSATVTAGSVMASASANTVVDTPPTANNGSLGIVGGAATSGTLSATPGSVSTLTYNIVTQPAHGTAVLTNASTGAFTYTPNTGFFGADSFTFDVSDGLLTSNTATENLTVATSTVALALTYTGPNNVSVVAGQNLVYNLTATNTDSSQPAVNVVLTGTLVAGVTLVSDSAAGGNCTATATAYTCTIDSLAPGATWTPSVTVQIGSADAGQSVLAASANVNAENSSNNPSISASVSVAQVSTTLDLTYLNFAILCNETNYCPNVEPGDTFPYVIVVSNGSSQSATNVLVTVTIPPGMTFSNPLPKVSGVASGVCLIDVAEAKMACALDTLAPTNNSSNSNAWFISFTATVNSTDTQGQVLTSQAIATSDNAGTSPAETVTAVVGTPVASSGGSSIGWLELLVLGGLCWIGRRRLAKASA